MKLKLKQNQKQRLFRGAKSIWDGEMSDRLALDKAIEIVKRGGRDEE